MKILATTLCLSITIASFQGKTCTTMALPQSANKIVAKNMDWPTGWGGIFINKRHVKKTSLFVPPPQVPLTWESKYMSLTFTQTGREFPWEGMNEAGLSVNIMQLMSSQVPAMDARPAVNSLQWIQYILDTSATTAEAIANAQKTRITGPMVTTLHFFVCDVSSQCAAFENVNGMQVVYTGQQLPYSALTNNTYAESVTYLKQQLSSKDPKTIMAQTDYLSLDRFSRAALYAASYTSAQDPISYSFSVLQNVSDAKNTQWSMIFSLVTKQVYYHSLTAPQNKLIDLQAFSPSCKQSVKMLNINLPQGGDVTSAFVDYNGDQNQQLVNLMPIPPDAQKAIGQYPETTTCDE